MKIIIIGAGIAGTSAYLQLTKHLPAPPSPSPPHEIVIYESHKPRAQPATTPATLDNTNLEEQSAAAIIGGGLGVAPNGMRVLAQLSQTLHDKVQAQGFPCEHFTFRAARGWKLASLPTRDERCPGEVCVASTREGLWRILWEEVESQGDVIKYRRVTEVRWGEDGRPVVRFDGRDGEEGGEESADLVVGADGVWSTVRKALFGDDFAPKYTGLAGIGGFINKPLPEEVLNDKSMVFTFGGNGFFGYGSAGPAETNNMMWWSTYQSTTPPNRKILDVAAVKKQLQDRHRAWKDPVIQDIIKTVDFDSINPTWTTPSLPHWGEKGLVLVGDSAHALPPTSGQGASQALEDSLTFSLTLAHYLSKCYDSGKGTEKDAVEVATKVFYEVRQPRVHDIAVVAERMDGNKKDIGFMLEMLVYGFFWLINRYPWMMKIMAGDVQGRLHNWKAEEVVQKAVAKKDAASATTN